MLERERISGRKRRLRFQTLYNGAQNSNTPAQLAQAIPTASPGHAN